MRAEHPNKAPDKTRARNAKALEQAWKALELRKAGKGYRAIALKLRCSLATAHGYVAKALLELREQVHEKSDELREVELLKLDKVEEKLWSRLQRNCSPADTAKLTATLVKVAESRRRLLGLDAPQRIEATGNLYTVATASPECAEWSGTGEPARNG